MCFSGPRALPSRIGTTSAGNSPSICVSYETRAIAKSSLDAVNAHPIRQHLRIENSSTVVVGQSASEALAAPLSLDFWYRARPWRPEVGNFLPWFR